MNANQTAPQTLHEAILHFANPDTAFNLVKNLRWPNGVACPHCGSVELCFLNTRRLWKCKGCKKQFSVKVGTIFEDSPIGLDKWLAGIWLITNAKNGVSSYEVHRALGVTQKTAWFLLRRIRRAMQRGSIEKMTGQVEADETYVGGKEKNKHKDKKQNAGRGTVGKAIVMGLLERHSEGSKVKAKVVSDTTKETLQGEVQQSVEPGSEVFTDTLPSYEGLSPEYVHEAVNHAEEYVQGHVHTNGLENFWSLFKRCIHGTYVSISDPHLYRYVDEEAFRFNERKGKDGDRFEKVVSSVSGKRLTYKELTESHLVMLAPE